MGEAWVGILGVIIGSVIAAVAQVCATNRQRQWQREESQRTVQREREARLFDHKRKAYADFFAAERRLYTWCFDHNPGAPAEAAPADDEADTFFHVLHPQVKLIGSAEVVAAADSLVPQLASWLIAARSPGRDWGEAMDAVNRAETAYKDAGRKDLGLSVGPSV